METKTGKTQKKWALDSAHSEITFKVRHMMISNVKGEFRNFTVEVDGEDITKSNVNVIIDASSITTNNEDRDNHLKSADFLDVQNHKEITFKSTSVNQIADGEFELNGILNIKGISKEITLDVELGGIAKDPWGNEKAGFSITGKINRKEWDLNWNTALEAGGVLVGDKVNISCEVQFTKQS